MLFQSLLSNSLLYLVSCIDSIWVIHMFYRSCRFLRLYRGFHYLSVLSDLLFCVASVWHVLALGRFCYCSVNVWCWDFCDLSTHVRLLLVSRSRLRLFLYLCTPPIAREWRKGGLRIRQTWSTVNFGIVEGSCRLVTALVSLCWLHLGYFVTTFCGTYIRRSS